MELLQAGLVPNKRLPECLCPLDGPLFYVNPRCPVCNPQPSSHYLITPDGTVSLYFNRAISRRKLRDRFCQKLQRPRQFFRRFVSSLIRFTEQKAGIKETQTVITIDKCGCVHILTSSVFIPCENHAEMKSTYEEVFKGSDVRQLCAEIAAKIKALHHLKRLSSNADSSGYLRSS